MESSIIYIIFIVVGGLGLTAFISYALGYNRAIKHIGEENDKPKT